MRVYPKYTRVWYAWWLTPDKALLFPEYCDRRNP